MVDLSDERVNFITEDKVSAAIASFGSFKAAGADGIKPIALKIMGSKMAAFLTALFKASVLLKFIPICWRDSKVNFIHKPGKTNYADARSCRPISLMSCIIKVLERLILWAIQETALIEKPLSSNQHAFRKGRSTD